MFVLLVLVLLQGSVRAEAAQRHTLDEFGYMEIIYDNSNGLDSSAANDVVQTRDGFIWIGTYNGLTRYDGSSFYQFPVTSGIYSVADLYVSQKGELYIGTNDSGLALFFRGQISTESDARYLNAVAEPILIF